MLLLLADAVAATAAAAAAAAAAYASGVPLHRLLLLVSILAGSTARYTVYRFHGFIVAGVPFEVRAIGAQACCSGFIAIHAGGYG